MGALLSWMVVFALGLIIAGHTLWAWSIWKEHLEKSRKLKGSVSIETVCDECGHSMAQTGAYIFRKKYLCGKCLRKAISSLREERDQ